MGLNARQIPTVNPDLTGLLLVIVFGLRWTSGSLNLVCWVDSPVLLSSVSESSFPWQPADVKQAARRGGRERREQLVSVCCCCGVRFVHLGSGTTTNLTALWSQL